MPPMRAAPGILDNDTCGSEKAGPTSKPGDAGVHAAPPGYESDAFALKAHGKDVADGDDERDEEGDDAEEHEGEREDDGEGVADSDGTCPIHPVPSYVLVPVPTQQEYGGAHARPVATEFEGQ